MLLRLSITGLRRFIGKLVDYVWPHRLRTNALFADAFNAIADLRACIALDGTLHGPFVVINEQSRRSEYRLQPLLNLIKLMRRGDGICGATSQLSLVVNFMRTFWAQIHRCR